MADRFDVSCRIPPSESKLAKEARDKALLEAFMEKTKKSRVANRQLRTKAKIESLKLQKQYREYVNSIIEARRQAKANGGLYRDAEPKVVFVIRLKGINKLCPKVRKILQLFRLRQINNAVFLPVNKATKEMLKIVDPFVAYGYPSISMIRKLIYKRGYLKLGRPGSFQRIRIQDNSIFQEKLSKKGVFGIEGMVRELFFCGPQFKTVNSLLWPFKLSSPRGGFVRKSTRFTEANGGDCGNREHLINKLIDRMC
ncbi:60S ribosomal protein L7, putative [Cryptosporidium muris RN66]|uniref:60S ribosomal protein L7, putative n=1 Tax=Cryptosporidium muris (strain RN66) TaxID=441375 RepID=B6AA57_CRYMR|nr:60S ribosomal protein L7, putative [Cryptosporidium muris RN66]EEA05098.1 60S ribosomal protein L7, putative [Cryptosporidium muris RN66]|eukprot:XP_002139447.1 60S ribosomal protein L7 [Cryptosporidium muris RN66]